MRLCSFMSLSVIAVPVFLTIPVQSAMFRGPMDTSSGYCVSESFGRIPVGGYGYDDDGCTQYICEPGGFVGVGCGKVMMDNPGCQLVGRPGHNPNCCKTVECEDEDD